MKTASQPAPLEALAASTYWEQRARRFARGSGGLKAVCSFGMPWFYNKAIDLCQRRALQPWVKHTSNKSVLDIGCGVGRWSLQFAEQGCKVTGLDLSPYMVERARENAAAAGVRCDFVSGDVREYDFQTRFDLIVCVTVIQHIMCPTQATRALANLVKHLAPGGELVLLEAAPTARSKKCDSAVFKARDFDWYRQTLKMVGMQVEEVRGVDPVPWKIRFLPHYRKLPAPLAWTAMAAITAISLPFDWLLGPSLVDSSWHKVIVARKVAEPMNAA